MKIPQDKGVWTSLVMEVAADLNDLKQAQEQEKKDEWKKRRKEDTQPASLVWKCEEPGCDFAGQTKADLVYHVRKIHSIMD